MDFQEIKDLVQFLEKSSFKKIAIKKGDFSLDLETILAEKESLVAPPKPTSSTAEQLAPEPVAEEQYVCSPMVGTFYSAPSPDQASFVKVGDSVQEDTVVCVIEAMKVMNEVRAGRKGVVKEILIENTQAVEFGTKMFRIV